MIFQERDELGRTEEHNTPIHVFETRVIRRKNTWRDTKGTEGI